MRPPDTGNFERRTKMRFPLQRDLRYKLMEDETVIEFGTGQTIDMGSGGLAFQVDHPLKVGASVELSISWPVLLGESCAMRLIVFGRVVRSWGRRSACRLDKYEFRTQARFLQPVLPMRNGAMLQCAVGMARMKASGC
jgi:hypothetical protein